MPLGLSLVPKLERKQPQSYIRLIPFSYYYYYYYYYYFLLHTFARGKVENRRQLQSGR